MEHSSMVDVKTYKCFPTSIHEVKLNIDYLDKKQMLQYVQLKGKDDDLHRIQKRFSKTVIMSLTK